MDRHGIRTLIEQEIARPEVQESLHELQATKRDRIADTFKHPVTLTILGFLLTSLVGTYISNLVADRAQRDTELQAALKAVGEFASEASELRVQQSYLVAAMVRGERGDVLSKVKVGYDESFLSWNASRYRNFLTLRNFFGFTYDNFAEQLVSRTIHQDFKAYNTCLGATYVAYIDAEGEIDARDRMDMCLTQLDRPGVDTSAGRVDAVARLDERVFQCSRRIFDTVHHFIARDIHCGKDVWDPVTGRLSGIYDAIWAECGIGEKRPLNTHNASFDAFCTMQDQDKGWFR